MADNRMTKDTVTGVVAVVLGSAYLMATANIPIMDAGDQVGPRAFPYLVAVVVLFCGVWLLVKEFLNKSRQPLSWGFVSERGVWLRILLTMTAGITYGLVLDWLGYIIATFLFMIFVCELINVGRHAQNLLIAAAFPVITFFAFAVFLKLSLPRGILGGVLPV